ncbi:MAG: hypothetical protein HY675_20045 [Chloroflexi bacterium]|nr:hypothetical protein [Chloroflexota bacterium]
MVESTGGGVIDPESPPSCAGSSVVTISGSQFDYVYTVNGQRQGIRGVGYNSVYRFLTPGERAERYRKDFVQMKKSGINTIIGWEKDKGYDHDRFDELTLGVAQEYGIGVIMPYYLPPDANYKDPSLREWLKQNVAAMVERFKDCPAVRMWGIGNEVLFAIEGDERAQGFAEFYVELADMVRQLDPNHPVLYREAEDPFAYFIAEALARDGVKRPWLAYGMNIYTYRIQTALASWRTNGWDGPVIVSEFAPIGVNRGERADAYVSMWNIIRSHPAIVLGGILYVWTTAGPEPVDGTYGLVDENGVPVDESLAKMTAVFNSEALAEVAEVGTGEPLSRR